MKTTLFALTVAAALTLLAPLAPTSVVPPAWALAAPPIAPFVGFPTPGETRDSVPPTLDDFTNSAAPPYGTLTVNVDIAENGAFTAPDTSGIGVGTGTDTSAVWSGGGATPEPGTPEGVFPAVVGDATVLFSTNGQASWTAAPLSAIPGASGGTWEGSFAIGAGDVVYYFIAREDSSAAMSAPTNAADAFPPGANLMADPADEPAGDAYTPNSHAVDLTGASFGYSDEHLYATLSNATGTWPFSGGILGPWYLYSAILGNPDAAQSNRVVAMVYTNIPLVSVLTGLYVVDASDSTYTRIGDIDAVVQGGKLCMRCNLGDLYAEPGFGALNPSGFYYTGAGTGTITIAGDSFENDQTHAYAFYHRTDIAAVGTNTPPTLDGAGWEIIGGDAPGSEPGSPGAGRAEVLVRFSVTYADADDHLAVTRNAIVDGIAHEMVAAVPEHNYVAGVRYEVDLTLAEGEHTFSFSFSDGLALVETEPDTALIQSTVAGESDVVTVEIVSPETSGGEVQFECSLGGAPDGRLDIYDVAGRLVKRIELTTGRGMASWNLKDESGRRVASGVYFVALTSAAGRDDSKLVIVR